MFRYVGLFSAIALSAAAAGCGGRMPFDGDVDREHTAVRVDNESTTDAYVYAFEGAAPSWQLGFVAARSTKSFLVPEKVLLNGAALQLQARHFRNGERLYEYTLPFVQVGVGQTVAVTLASNPAMSSAAVIVPRHPVEAKPDST